MSSSNTFYFNYPAFNPIEQRKKSRLVAGLLLTMVMVLHLALALYLLNVPETEPKKPPVVIEVVMLPNSGPLVKQAAKEPPPVKKAPVKPKPVIKPPEPVKKPVVVKKPAPAPKPQPAAMKEVVPAPAVVEPAPAVAPSAPSNSRAAATTTETTGHSKTVVSGVVPLVRVPPKYPARAANRHIEGWVKVEFIIQTDGSVDDAVVVSSEPENIFDDAALTAIGKWKFKEKIVNGVAVQQRAVQKLQFKLER